VGGPVRRWNTARIALVLVLSAAALTSSCWNPVNDYLRGWAGLHMIWVQGGILELGSDDWYSDEAPAHLVSVTSFEMSPFEITQGLYETIIGTNPSYNSADPSAPVEQVSWGDAVLFCNQLSLFMGYDPCYSILGDWVTVDPSKDGYRLPTEAEWEYAARGGVYTSGFLYSGSSSLSKVAWYLDNSGDSIHPVGDKEPNELGLYDMSGNVVEWCWDYYLDTWYTDNPGSWSDTFGPGGTTAQMNTYSQYFVVKGGSFLSPQNFSRSSMRFFIYDTDLYIDTGFRVVRRPS